MQCSRDAAYASMCVSLPILRPPLGGLFLDRDKSSILIEIDTYLKGVHLSILLDESGAGTWMPR